MDQIERELYEHLPYYELFARHQGDYLDETDWLKIVKTIEDKTLEEVKGKQ